MSAIGGAAGFVLFFAMWAVSLWLFSAALYGRISLLARGTPDSRIDQPWERAMGVLRNVVMHSALLREPYPGILHLFIFYGFMVLAVGNLFLFGEALLPSAFKILTESPVYGLVSFGEDIFCLLVYFGLAMAAYRRYVERPDRLEGSSPDATIIILLITGIVTCALFIDVFRFAGEPRIHVYQNWAIVASFLSRYFTTFSQETLGFLYTATWWIHLTLILFFLVYIPRSKHMHLIACAFNEYFRNLEPKGRLSKLDIENAETFGAEKIEDLSWKQLLDLFACVECGRCMENCPTARSGKKLNPKILISDLKNHLLEKGSELEKNRSSLIYKYVIQKDIPFPVPSHERELLVKEGFIKGPEGDDKKSEATALSVGDTAEGKELVGGGVSEEAIWDCTSCGYCIEHCPFYIEHTSKIFEMRRYLTLMLKSYPTQVKNFLKNVQRNSNPWGIGWQQRADWAKGLKIPFHTDVEVGGPQGCRFRPDGEVVKDPPFGETPDHGKDSGSVPQKGAKDAKNLVDDRPDSNEPWLLYVGCAGSFDARNMKVTIALCELLKKAGVSFGILGKDEKCCGETARRMGEEGLFQAAVETNIELFKEMNVKKIITLCPHCFNTFKNEYPSFGGNYEVVHHSELLPKLIEEGKLKTARCLPLKVSFHDSCYLGRYNKIYDGPRALLQSATGNPIMEMPRNLDRSFCCGAGGGRMWMEETVGEKINVLRTKEALETGANCLASACPYCLTMLNDGVKAANREDVATRDIAEILLESLS